MAYRDRAWYEQAYATQKKIVTDLHDEIGRYIEGADYSLAAIKCDRLKVELEKQNNLANRFADLEEKVG